MDRFRDKTVVVTGAGSGIGQAIALRLVNEGAFVLGIDINEDGLKQTQEAASYPERVSIAVVSVTDEQLVTEKVNEYVSLQGRLDVLVNAAGILRASPTINTSLEQFRLVIEINLIGTFLMCRICLPHLIITKGNIVNIASTSAFFGPAYMAGYAASKGGVVALTKSLAREYILEGVRANAVAPGGIDTPLITDMEWPKETNFALFDHTKLPNERIGKPEEVAGVVAMLASQDGSYINGEVIRIDGGTHS